MRSLVFGDRGLVAEAGFRVRAFRGAIERPSVAAVVSDEARLSAPFRARLDEVLRLMRADGFDPRVYETWRSLERAKELEAKGVGVARSMHCWGLAADVIDRAKLWNASSAFWIALRDHSEALGLTSGARFATRHDLPHVQAVPVAYQWLVRATALDDQAGIDRIAARFCPPLPALA